MNQMLIFDVDGVMTNPHNKLIAKKELLEKIAQELENGQIVAFNTGRALQWIIDRVIYPLSLVLKNKSFLQSLYVVGEKGGTWLNFDGTGKEQISVDKNISIPQDLQKAIKELVDKEFSKYVFYDKEKLTMVSVEMRNDISFEEFDKIHDLLTQRIKETITKLGLDEEIHAIPTTIDVDIENKYVGKDFAVRRILKWLKEKGMEHESFITLGDGVSDIEMAQELYKQGYKVIFVYVGEDELPKTPHPFEVITTQEHFDKGTLEYLNSL